MAYPYLNVTRNQDMFRMLNAHDSYFTEIQFFDPAQNIALPFDVMARYVWRGVQEPDGSLFDSEQGMMDEPKHMSSIVMGPAERFEIVLDLTTIPDSVCRALRVCPLDRLSGDSLPHRRVGRRHRRCHASVRAAWPWRERAVPHLQLAQPQPYA